ncbi:alpha-L-fucosidase [Rhodopirellula sallentina SM41]|uniref:Alpha-L-fucosidase n=1 Tax=Rhodopirellula sallentina SM41 TaxID=1263870 RepID=M5TUK5_9BACT|nr:alpha-L-fucosidase [Rhodopirellula sallentina SM41]
MKLVRNQAELEISILTAAYIITEAGPTQAAFSKLVVPSSPSGTIAASRSTNNAPLNSLLDGRLEDGYGPVFGNNAYLGTYRIDLGSTKTVNSVTNWTANHNGNRGPQNVTIYASTSKNDPGWDLTNRSRFTPIGTIDTTMVKPETFNAASIRAKPGQSLGRYRWIYWQTNPVTNKGENTAFQELAVESSPAR